MPDFDYLSTENLINALRELIAEADADELAGGRRDTGGIVVARTIVERHDRERDEVNSQLNPEA